MKSILEYVINQKIKQPKTIFDTLKNDIEIYGVTILKTTAKTQINILNNPDKNEEIKKLDIDIKALISKLYTDFKNDYCLRFIGDDNFVGDNNNKSCGFAICDKKFDTECVGWFLYKNDILAFYDAQNMDPIFKCAEINKELKTLKH